MLKLDFEKAYDKVNCDFLFQGLMDRGFNEKWMDWFKIVVKGGTLNVKSMMLEGILVVLKG